ncbi:histidine phosphatase family protein [Aneurinibacillus tyrosinisolvens]|uniref:histidine phosphatase family protein n=1 Tax=Aneurinibacillus tyrosinisolvens TaxID=1443435 RepID=UPI00063EDC1A|nr:histidine phosphatase family protein [Aneurinibacillus tyrosinisolvens]
MRNNHKKHVYLVRHGQTDWNVQRRIQGHSDIPLNNEGVRQARLLADKLKEIPFTLVCSSDLQRAIHTARYLADAKGIQVEVYPGLRERHYGLWEGEDYETVRAQFPDFDPGNDHMGKYKVETFSEMQHRGVQCLHEIAENSDAEHVLIVSHGGLINAVLHHMSGGEHGTGKTRLTNTSINYATYENSKWMLHTVNDDSHLE